MESEDDADKKILVADTTRPDDQEMKQGPEAIEVRSPRQILMALVCLLMS